MKNTPHAPGVEFSLHGGCEHGAEGTPPGRDATSANATVQAFALPSSTATGCSTTTREPPRSVPGSAPANSGGTSPHTREPLQGPPSNAPANSGSTATRELLSLACQGEVRPPGSLGLPDNSAVPPQSPACAPRSLTRPAGRESGPPPDGEAAERDTRSSPPMRCGPGQQDTRSVSREPPPDGTAAAGEASDGAPNQC